MKRLIGLALVVTVVALTAALVIPVMANNALPVVNWLPPLANQGEFQLKDGSTLPIKFTLTDPVTGAFVEDTGLRVDVNQVLFRDDFDDGSMDGWTPVSGDTSWSADSGMLYTSGNATYPRILADATSGYTDYVFEADARLISGPGYALLFRAADHGNLYSFQYDPGAGLKLRLYQFANFPSGADVTSPVPYAIDNDWHQLKVVVSQNDIKCYIDGNKVFDVRDTVAPAPLEGGIGFRTWGAAKAEFDNVMVTALPAAKTFCYGTGSDNVRISYDTIFSDDFERTEVGDDWQLVSGSHGIVEDNGNNVYQHVGGSYVGAVTAVTGDADWDNYVLQVDLKKLSGAYFNLIFRYVDENNYYMLEGGSTGGTQIKLYKRVGGSFALMGAADQSTVNNVWYHYDIRVQDDSIRVWADDVLKFDVVDATHAAGKIGIGGYNSNVYFDDVAVQVPHYIANLHTRESGITPGEDYWITVWSGAGNQLGTYLFQLTDDVRGTGRGKGKA